MDKSVRECTASVDKALDMSDTGATLYLRPADTGTAGGTAVKRFDKPQAEWMTEHTFDNGVTSYGNGSTLHVGTFGLVKDAVEGGANGEARYLAHGVSRDAYVSADNRWVAKVPRSGWSGTANVMEYQWMRLLRANGFPFVGPVALWSYQGIMVVTMPYYPRTVDSSPKAMDDLRNMVSHGLIRKYGCDAWCADDMHRENVRCTATGRLRIIDLGEFHW